MNGWLVIFEDMGKEIGIHNLDSHIGQDSLGGGGKQRFVDLRNQTALRMARCCQLLANILTDLSPTSFHTIEINDIESFPPPPLT